MDGRLSYSPPSEPMRKVVDYLTNEVGDVSKGRYDWRILRISTACVLVGAERCRFGDQDYDGDGLWCQYAG